MCSTAIVSHNVTMTTHFVPSQQLVAYVAVSSSVEGAQFCIGKLLQLLRSIDVLLKQLLCFLLQFTYKHLPGMDALPRIGSSCHNVNWRSWKWENTHPDPFNSNTSMTFSSCRLTSSSGGAASAYTAIISEVRVTGGCVTTLGSTAL